MVKEWDRWEVAFVFGDEPDTIPPDDHPFPEFQLLPGRHREVLWAVWVVGETGETIDGWVPTDPVIDHLRTHDPSMSANYCRTILSEMVDGEFGGLMRQRTHPDDGRRRVYDITDYGERMIGYEYELRTAMVEQVGHPPGQS